LGSRCWVLQDGWMGDGKAAVGVGVKVQGNDAVG
jgi:hypothetical protein